MGRTQVLSTQPTPIFPSQLLFSRPLHQLPLHLCPVGAEGMSAPAAGCGSRPEHVLPASVPARVHVRERIPIPCLRYWEVMPWSSRTGSHCTERLLEDPWGGKAGGVGIWAARRSQN